MPGLSRLENKSITITQLAIPETAAQPVFSIEDFITEEYFQQKIQLIEHLVTRKFFRDAVLVAGRLAALFPHRHLVLPISEEHFFKGLETYDENMSRPMNSMEEELEFMVEFLATARPLFPDAVDMTVIAKKGQLIYLEDDVRASSQPNAAWAWRQAAIISVARGSLFDVSMMQSENPFPRSSIFNREEKWWERNIDFKNFLSQILVMRLFSPEISPRKIQLPPEAMNALRRYLKGLATEQRLVDVLNTALMFAPEVHVEKGGLMFSLPNENTELEKPLSPPTTRSF